MTGKNAGGRATQGEWEERKEGQADGQFIHSVDMDGFSQRILACAVHMYWSLKNKKKTCKADEFMFKKENLN